MPMLTVATPANKVAALRGNVAEAQEVGRSGALARELFQALTHIFRFQR
jgi:hypothetical protein